MSHKQFISAYETVPLGFLISVPKALRILFVHKIPDARFQLLLVKWACTLFAVLGVGICGFNLMPMFPAVVVFALGICFFALLLWLGAGDIILQFAFEDEWFFELATECHALSIFEDTELSLPQPGNSVCGSGERQVPRSGIFAARRLRHPFRWRFPSRPRTSRRLTHRRR